MNLVKLSAISILSMETTKIIETEWQHLTDQTLLNFTKYCSQTNRSKKERLVTKLWCSSVPEARVTLSIIVESETRIPSGFLVEFYYSGGMYVSISFFGHYSLLLKNY